MRYLIEHVSQLIAGAVQLQVQEYRLRKACRRIREQLAVEHNAYQRGLQEGLLCGIQQGTQFGYQLGRQDAQCNDPPDTPRWKNS